MTKHAMARIKQRVGLKGDQAVDAAKKAFAFGMGIGDFREKKQRKYLKKLLDKNSNDKLIKVHNNFVYIFGKDRVCITVWALPEFFAKKNVYAGKELLRHPAKYMRNYAAAELSGTLVYSA